MAGCSELKTESSVIVHCWAKVRLRSSVAFWNAFLNSNAMSSVLKNQMNWLFQVEFTNHTSFRSKLGL